MSKNFNEILFEDKLPVDALAITAGSKYDITVKEFFRGVYLLNEDRNKSFSYPLMFAYRTNAQTTEVNTEYETRKREQTIIIGLVKESDYEDAEKDVEILSKTLWTYLGNTANNSIVKTLGDNGESCDKYMIISDNTFTAKANNGFKAIAFFELKLTINS